MARTGILPTDPSFRELIKNSRLLAFTFHWLNKLEEDWWSRFNRTLGTVWNREDVLQMESTSETAKTAKQDRERIFTPLAMMLNPDIMKGLKKAFGGERSRIADEYIPEKGEQIVEMGDWSKEDFLAMTNMSKVLANSIKSGEKISDKLKIPDDPATKARMAEEINKSKGNKIK